MSRNSILIIEDDYDTAHMLRLYLELEGYNITICSRGKTGLQEAQKTYPDLILLDIALPDISGWEVYRRLKGQTDASILFITSFPDIEMLAKGLGITEDDYITKPLDSTDLIQKIRNHLHKETFPDSKYMLRSSTPKITIQTPYLSNIAPHINVNTSPIFGLPPEDTQYNCDIFMVMPFSDTLTHVYSDHIRPLAQALDLTIKRGDDFFSQRMIISEIWGAIFAAKVIIADCTGRNPNVFYEMGIAHTLGKKIITITQNKDDIPFDLQNYRYIPYKDHPDEWVKFETTLQRAIIKMLER